MNHRVLAKLLLLLCLTALGTYLFIHCDLYASLADKDRAIRSVKSFHPYDEVGFTLLQIVQVVVAPIPGEVTGLIGGYLYGPILGSTYSTIGLTIGSWLAFMAARFFGMPFVERIVSPKVIGKIDHFMMHRGLFVSFLLFLIPGMPKDSLCYIMGLSHMPTGTFLIISTFGRLLGTIMLTVSGDCARDGHYVILAVIIATSIVVLIPAYVFREKLHAVLLKINRAQSTE